MEKCTEQKQRFDTCPTCMAPFGDNSACQDKDKMIWDMLVAVLAIGVLISVTQIVIGILWWFGAFKNCCKKKKVQTQAVPDDETGDASLRKVAKSALDEN